MHDMTTVLDRRLQSLKATRITNAAGRVRRYDGQIVHASSFPASVGTECRVACERIIAKARGIPRGRVTD